MRTDHTRPQELAEQAARLRVDHHGRLDRLAKSSVIRLAVVQAADLLPCGVAATSLTPGFLRSEAMLDRFGVTEATWRDAVASDPTSRLRKRRPPRPGGAGVGLRSRHHGQSRQALTSSYLARERGFTDADGTQPDWGAHFKVHVEPSLAPEHR